METWTSKEESSSGRPTMLYANGTRQDEARSCKAAMKANSSASKSQGSLPSTG